MKFIKAEKQIPKAKKRIPETKKQIKKHTQKRRPHQFFDAVAFLKAYSIIPNRQESEARQPCPFFPTERRDPLCRYGRKRKEDCKSVRGDEARQ